MNDSRVNDKISKESIRIPFNNFIYVGDSDTDIPCMKIVKEKQRYSIGVYDAKSDIKYSKVVNLFKDGRINYFAECDYSIDAKLFQYVKNIIQLIKLENANSVLESECRNIVKDYEQELYNNDEDIVKENLVLNLNFSDSFAMTHTLVSEASKFNNWSDEQIIELGYITIKLIGY